MINFVNILNYISSLAIGYHWEVLSKYIKAFSCIRYYNVLYRKKYF